MAVDHEHALTAYRFVDDIRLDRNVSVSSGECAHELVVISWDVNHRHALARFAQDLLNHVVVLLWPVAAKAQLPDVDQIGDYIKFFAIVIAQNLSSASALLVRVPKCTSEIQAARTRRPDCDFGNDGSIGNLDVF